MQAGSNATGGAYQICSTWQSMRPALVLFKANLVLFKSSGDLSRRPTSLDFLGLLLTERTSAT